MNSRRLMGHLVAQQRGQATPAGPWGHPEGREAYPHKSDTSRKFRRMTPTCWGAAVSFAVWLPILLQHSPWLRRRYRSRVPPASSLDVEVSKGRTLSSMMLFMRRWSWQRETRVSVLNSVDRVGHGD